MKFNLVLESNIIIIAPVVFFPVEPSRSRVNPTYEQLLARI